MKEFMQKIPTWLRIAVGLVLFGNYIFANGASTSKALFFAILFAGWVALCLSIKCKPENQTQPFFVTDDDDASAKAPIPKYTSVKGPLITAVVIFILACAILGEQDKSYKQSTLHQTTRAVAYTDPPVIDDGTTMGMRNALRSAESYIDHQAFSRVGLLEQLEYEGYTEDECIYAVNNCGADWDVEAVEMASGYLRHMSFSRKELIEQLEFEGFSETQAVKAVNTVYQ